MSDWTDAERHAERAHRYFEAGQWQRALDEIRLALDYNPDQSEWQFGLALTLEALERYEEAAKAFERVLRLGGEDIEIMLHLGTVLMHCEKPDEAIAIFGRVEKLDPQCENCYCPRILAYAQKGDHASAELMFYLARQITDQCPTCYQNLGESLAIRGQLERALWCWRQTAKLDPQYPDIYLRLAHAHWHLGHRDKARHCFVRQMRENPGDIEALLAFGRLLMEMGRDAEAGEKFRRVLELDPTVAKAQYHLGELALLSRHMEAAEMRFEKARQLDATLPGPHLGLAEIAFHRDQTELARHLLQTELSLDEHSPAQLLDAARLLIELELPAEALTVLAELETEEQDEDEEERMFTVAVLLHRGAALMMLGRMSQGIALSRKAIDLDPENSVAMHNLALACLQVGRLRCAGYWLARGLALKPDDPALRHLRHQLWRAAIVRRLRRIARRPLSWLGR